MTVFGPHYDAKHTGFALSPRPLQVILVFSDSKRVYTGRLHFLNVQKEDYLLDGDNAACSGNYMCVVFNPFLRTTADGDDQCITRTERPGCALSILNVI